MMHQTRRIPIVQLNEYLTCKLCKGYFIDATTIIECLHTFCRSCIVRYLEKNKYCPICDVQVHKTKPLLNIRPDKALQDIVYKLVPRLFQNEMCRRREFYSSHPDARPSNLEQCGEASYQHILSPDETICLSLNYHGSTGPPRYLCCPAAVSVVHLQKLLRAKYDLMDRHRVDILHNQDSLNSHLTLMDIAYIYLWRRKGPLELTYRIYEMTTKKLTEDIPNPSGVENGDSCTNSAAEDKKNEWKEVQLTISESGEMCITGVDDGVLVKEEDAENCNVSMEVSDSKTPNNCADKHLLKTEDSSVSDSNTRIDSDVVKSDSDTQSAISETIAQSVGSADKIDNDQEGTKASKNNTLLPSSTHSDALVLTETVTTTKDAPAVSISSTVSTSTVHVTPKCSTSVSNNVLTSGSGSSTSCTTTLSTSSVSLLVSTNTSTFTTESSTSSVWTTSSGASRMTKHKLEDKSDGEPAVKQAKPSNLSQLYNLSNNHPLKKHSQTVRSKDPPDAKSSLPMSLLCPISATSALSITNCVAAPLTTCAASIKLSPPPYKPQLCYTPKTNYNPVINIPKVLVSTSLAKAEPKATSSTLVTTLTPPPINAKTHIKMKSSSPVGYKTLRDPPKTWNPQISRTSLMKSSPDPKGADLKNARPAKFFKLRNNMPRYLGNPASGVKPLYHVHTGPDKEKPETSGKSEKMEIKKHSIVKIDPKTLKPISEKAPETSSLSTPTPDLKINTSSVPIFNPLKLQSSPKNDRKSPKSPQPPRTKTNSPPNKNNKLNLNYTPPNPFVPNLASPTMNPNQFHFPGPPGFPTYDPRIIAAYQHLFYGQSVLYPPNSLSGMSSVDLNQRKNFDIPGPTSPKVPALPVSQSRHRTSPKNSESSNSKLLNDCNTVTILNPLASTNAAKLPKLPEPSRPPDNSLASSSGSGPKILNTKASLAKRPIKESGKGEKSLQTAVEKLTQNRVKMLNKVEAVNIKKEELPLPVKLEVNGKHDDVASSPLRNGTPKEVKEKANSVLFEPKVEEASIKLEINHVDSTDVKNLPSATDDKNLAASNNNNTDSVPLVTDTNK